MAQNLTTEQAATRQEFDRLINMTAEEMTAHYASPESDYASVPPPIAKKLKQVSGKTLGKTALKLKGTEVWTDNDYAEAANCTKAIKRFLGRSVAYQNAEGKATPFAISLMNRGHNPLKARPVGAPALAELGATVAEGEVSSRQMDMIISTAVRDALRTMMGGEYPDGADWPWVREYFPQSQYAIVEWMGTLYRIPYVLAGTNCTPDVSAIEEVTIEYVPVTEPDDVVPGVITEVAEAVEGVTEAAWSGIMIRAGEAKNKASNGKPRIYTEEALQEAVKAGLFDNVPGYDRTDAEHSVEEGEEPCGTWGKAVWDATAKAVKNTFQWAKGALPKAVNGKVKNLVAEGKITEVPGFSITGDILAKKSTPNIIEKIIEIRSCDPVTSPSAGGIVTKVTESHHKESHTMKKSFAQFLKEHDAFKGAKIPEKLPAEFALLQVAEASECSDYMIAYMEKKSGKPMSDAMKQFYAKNQADLVSQFAAVIGDEESGEGDQKGADDAAAAAGGGGTATPATEVDAAKAVREGLAQIHNFALEGMLSQSNLPDPVKVTLRSQFGGEKFDTQKVQEAITSMKDMIAGVKKTLTPQLTIQVDEADKLQTAWNDLFFYDVPDVAARTSVAEAQISRGKQPISKHKGNEILSVKRLCEMALGRQIDWYNREQVQEAMDTVVASAVLTNGMNLRLVWNYNLANVYRDCFRFVNIVPLPDMKTKNVLASGSLTGWAAKNPSTGYATLAASGASKESYTPDEYGGIHDIEWKNFVNDDVGYFQSIPKIIADVALLAINDYIWGTLVAGNPTLTTDSTAVFATAHGNIMNTALADASLTDAIGKLQQVQRPAETSGRPLMSIPKFLAVTSAVTQQKKAYELVTPAYGLVNSVAGFVQKMGIEVLVNPISTDLNDWWLFGQDPASIIELGFYGGQTDPVITIANDPGVGKKFTHNVIQVKGDHNYAGNWVTYRHAVWSQVAG